MHPTRRQFLTTVTAAAALTGLRLPAEAKDSRPLPELVPDRDLKVVPIDVEASNARRELVIADGGAIADHPEGCILQIPSGAEIGINGFKWQVRGSHRHESGARLVIRGEPGGKPPLIHSTNKWPLVGVGAGDRKPHSLELENLRLRAPASAEACVRAVNFRYVRLSNVSIEGGRNGIIIPMGPTVVEVFDSTIARGGRGDGKTHSVYINYVERFTARRSTFTSARAPGHALKCYGALIDIRNCTMASWASDSDRAEGCIGELPPVDLGAWSRTVLVGNTFVRRGPARQCCLEYRNRQFAKGTKDAFPDWGTSVADHHLVDNRDDGNPHLFHHFLIGNRFINGILPNGSRDPSLIGNPGIAVRNNGCAPWASHGDMEAKPIRPDDVQEYNERSVVWAKDNAFEGIPFERQWEEIPYKQPLDRAPIRVVRELPAWADLG